MRGFGLVAFVVVLCVGCSANNNSQPSANVPTHAPAATVQAAVTAAVVGSTVGSTAQPTVAASVSPAAAVTRPPSAQAISDAAPCSVGQVKGNRTSKLYHVPSGRDYAKTVSNVQCFDTAAAAESAGYTAAKQ